MARKRSVFTSRAGGLLRRATGTKEQETLRNKFGQKIGLILLVAIFVMSGLLSRWIQPASAQFIDRLVRPCATGGSSGTVQVTTTNILINPCPGGSVTINGVPITPGPGVTINPTIGTVPYKSGAAAFGDSPITRLSATHMRFFANAPGGADFDTSAPAITLNGVLAPIRIGDALGASNQVLLLVDDQANQLNAIASSLTIGRAGGGFAGIALLSGDNATTGGSIDLSAPVVAGLSGRIRLGDTSNAGNRTRISIDDRLKQILQVTGTLGSFTQLADSEWQAVGTNGTNFPGLDLTGSNGKATLGDYLGFLNSTTLVVDDSGKTITFNAVNGAQFTNKVTKYNNAAPVDGQVLIGGTAAGNWTAGTISGSPPIVVTNGNNTVAVSCPTCGTGSGSVTGTGTTGAYTKWTNGAGGVLGDSLVSESGTVVTAAATAIVSNSNGATDLGSSSVGYKQLFVDATITAGGTTGDRTINKSAGSVNFAAAATSLTVTSNKVTTSSVVLCTVATNDTTLKSVQCVAAAGSFQMFGNAAATAETRVNFWVLNQ